MKIEKRYLLLIGLIAVLLGAGLLYRYLPSNEWMSLEEYYSPTPQGKAVMILNDAVQEEQAWVEQEICYLPVTWVNRYLDSRFYSDGSSVILTDAQHLWMYYPEDSTYLLDGEEQSEEQVKVIRREDALYLRLDWVVAETGIVVQSFENPARIWIWNELEQEIPCAKTEKEVSVRYRAGIKSPILEKVAADEQVFVGEEVGSWTNVQTPSGIVGYVKTKDLGETYTIWMEQKSGKLEYASQNLQRRLSMVWHQTIGTDGLDNLNAYVEAQLLKDVDVILPSWFTLSDNEGNMEYRGNAAYVELAHENQLQVWAMLDNLNIPVDTLAILSDTQVRFRIEEALMEYAGLWGVDGINIDLEAITEEMAVHYIQFLRELSILCRREGLILSVDHPMPQAWNAYYGMGEQAEFVDYIILMGYDEHWAGGEAGSTASYRFVKEGIELALSEVPKERLINGIPWYTRVWDMESQESYAIGMSELQQHLYLGDWNQLESIWLEEERQNYLTFVKDDTSYQVWMEDLQSMAWRLDLAHEYDLAGISCWKLNFEIPEVWDMLAEWKKRE